MSSGMPQPETSPIVACTISRDVQNFDLLIEDMEASVGENWGDLMASGRLNDYVTTISLFRTITRALDILHQGGQFIPHLIPDDIIVIQDRTGNLTAKIDYKLSRFIDPKLDRPGPQLKRLLE